MNSGHPPKQKAKIAKSLNFLISTSAGIAAIGTLLFSLFTTPAFADDFVQLRAEAAQKKTVSVLVTGWVPITGGTDNINRDIDAGTIAITGDDFTEKMAKASSQTRIVRRYETLPVLAMEMDKEGLEAAKGYSSTVQIWEDQELHPVLLDSMKMIGTPPPTLQRQGDLTQAVVVIDDGVKNDHTFLESHMVEEVCFSDNCPNGKNSMIGKGAARSLGTHGTHVAGIVLGSSSHVKIKGVNPNVGLIAINIFNKSGKASASNLLAALEFVQILARKKPGLVSAVNMSLGATRKRGGICRNTNFDLISKNLTKLNIPVVVASGNNSKKTMASPIGFPACIEGFISVGAVSKKMEVASFSNSGKVLDLLAPGVGIISSASGPQKHAACTDIKKFYYCALSGTSMASPHVSGALSLLKGMNPNRSVAELLQILKTSGTMVKDPRNNVSVPMINVSAAINLLQKSNPSTRRRPTTREPATKEPTARAPKTRTPATKEPIKEPVAAPAPRQRQDRRLNRPAPEPKPSPEDAPEATPEPAPAPSKEKDDQWNAITG